MRVNKNVVSQHEIDILESNFQKKASLRNFDFIEEIAHKLKYL